MWSIVFIISPVHYPSQDPNQIDTEHYAEVTDDVTHWVLLCVLAVQQFRIPVLRTSCSHKMLVTCHVGVVWWEPIKDE